MKKEGKGFEVQEFSVSFRVRGERVPVLHDMSIHLTQGGVMGIIGESGSGKSVFGEALFGLLPESAELRGKVRFDGKDVFALTQREKTSLWGSVWGLVPQLPQEALSPLRTIDGHLRDVRRGAGMKSLTQEKAAELLRSFELAEPERVLRSYPHELSGGMLQRVLCAMAAACRPAWILADEPTKGLDEDAREAVGRSLARMAERTRCTLLVITHDIVLAHSICDRLIVMYEGEIVELLAVAPELAAHHPYTQALLRALPENGFEALPLQAETSDDDGSGCRFAQRCAHADARCRRERPSLYAAGSGKVRCFLYAGSASADEAL